MIDRLLSPRRSSSLISVVLVLMGLMSVGCGSHPGNGTTTIVAQIKIAADAASINAGMTTQLHAMSTDSNGKASDVTSSVSWSSSVPTVAAVSTSGLLSGVAAGTAMISASLNGVSGILPATIGAPAVTGLTLSPSSTAVFTNGKQTFTAFATYANNTSGDASSAVKWAISPANVATIAAGGVVTAIAPGTFSVTATAGVLNATAIGSVVDAPLTGIAVTPGAVTMSGGGTQQFTATGTYADKSTKDLTSQVTWTTSDVNVLTVNASGLGSGQGTDTVETVTVTATLGAMTAISKVRVTANITVTQMTVLPTSSSLATGTVFKQTAIATYSDGSQQDVTNEAVWSVVPATTSSARTGGVTAKASVSAKSSLAGADTSLTAKDTSTSNTTAAVDQTGRTQAMNPGTAMVQASMLGAQAQTTVIVTPATVATLAIRATRDLFPVGATQPVQLIGTFSDGTTQDLSLTANWVSSDPTIATIDQTGLATGLKGGAVVFTGSFGGLTASTIGYQVLPSALLSLTLTIDYPISIIGFSQRPRAIGTYSDGTTHDLTQLTTWSSSDPDNYPISSDGLAFCKSPTAAQFTGTVAGYSALLDAACFPVVLGSLDVEPTNPSFALGTTLQMAVDAHFVGSTDLDIAKIAVWRSEDPSVLTIDANGIAKAGKVGTTRVTATHDGITSESSDIHVTAATMVTLHIFPVNIRDTTPVFQPAQVAVFTGKHLLAYGFFSDGSFQDVTRDVTWNTTDNTTASIDTTGYVIGMKPGQLQVTATYGALTSSLPLTVTGAKLASVAITPGSSQIPLQSLRQYTLTGTFNDGTQQDLTADSYWLAPTPSIDSVLAAGKVIGSTPGVGQVKAQYGYFSATTPVTVTSAQLVSMALTPANASIRQYALQPYTNTGTFDDGETLDLAIGTVISSQNQLTAQAVLSGAVFMRSLGTTQLTAKYHGQTTTTGLTVTSDVVSRVEVTPANATILPGTTAQFQAVMHFDDGSSGTYGNLVTWTSSNPAALSIDAYGVATASPTANATVTVTATFYNIEVGNSTGSTTVVVGTGGGSTLSGLAVTPVNPTLLAGTTQQFHATGTYPDGTTGDVTAATTWVSTIPLLFSIDKNGLGTALSVVGLAGRNGLTALAGTTTSVPVTASSGGASRTFNVNVVPTGGSTATLTSVAVSPSSASFAKGTTQQFTLTGTYSDGTTQDLTSQATWTTTAASVAMITSSGLATGTGIGSVQITGAYSGKSSSTGTVSVTPATLASVSVTPTSAHAAAGTMVQLTAMGTYTDGSTADVSSSATWTTSDPTLATVNTTGLVKGVSAGLAMITAQVGSYTSSATVRVSAATLTSVAISPNSASFAAGTRQKFTMTGTFSDGSTQDLSNASTWSSSATSVATVDSTGLVTGVAAGPVAFTASYNGQTAMTATVTVAPATLVSIAVTPANPSFAKGTTTQFHVTGTYSDGSMRDLTGSSTFTSSDPTVVSISSTGAGQGLSLGSVQITVSTGGQTASTGTVTVTPATLSSIAITPPAPSFAAGTTQQFMATGTFSDGSTQDLSGQVVWTSSNPQVMTIGSTGVASSFQIGTAQVTAALNGTTAMTGTIHITPATLSSLAVSPSAVQIAKGTVKQLTATGTYTDGTTQNLSTSVTWTTSDGTVIAINANGLATGVGLGSATLMATTQGQTASTTSFQVTAATLVSIAFSPANPTVAAGSSAQVMVIGTFSDGSTQDLSSAAMYSSSNPSVATVNGGLLAGVGVGSSTVTVQVNGVTSSFSATVSTATLVSIALTPTNPSAVAKGTMEQFTAIGTYSDGSTQNITSVVNWSSSNTGVFTVNQLGQATGTGVGNAQLTASYQGQTATTPSFQGTLATVSSLAVTPGNLNLIAGNTQQYTATATYTDGTTQDVSSTVVWSTTNLSVATIGSTGLVSAVAVGNVAVTAQFSNLTSTANLTVSGAAVTLQQIVVTAANGSNNASVGGAQQYIATAVYSDQSTKNVSSQATWSSTNTGVATVNSTGLATALAAGNTAIQAQFGGMTGTANLTVASQAPTLQSLAISPSTASVAKGLTQQFTATGTYSDGSTQNLTTLVTWMSSNTVYATINTNGLATSTTGGQTSISASYQGQTTQVTLTVSAATLVSLALTPSSVNLANGTKQQIIATGTLSDGSTQDFTTSVTWSSGNTSFATVSATGVVGASGVGTVTITAQAGSVSQTATVSVTAATPSSIQLTPTSVTVPVGGVQQMQATAMFSDGSSQDVTSSVTYTTSNGSVVTVDANGELHGVGTGTASVTATLGSVSKTSTVTITSVALTSLAITPTNVSLAAGLSQQLTATGTFADGSTQDLTHSVTWSSSNPQVAAVSTTGKVTVSQVGSVTITATTDSISATDSVTATAAAVTTISVSPGSTTLAAGQTQQFAATASFTDGSQQTVTSSVNWSVSDPAKGTISNSGSTKGFFTSSTAGMLNVTATLNGTSGSAPVTVMAAALTSLQIAPSPVSVPAGTTQALTVTGHYTDGSTQNVTASTAWTSGSASVATVNASGVLHGITSGTTSVTATVGSTTATDTVTVTAAVLSSISVIPSAPSVALGLHQQMTATGTYTDGSTMDVTSQVQWSSSSASVATISGTGLVSTLHTGTSTLTATLNSISGTAALTVTQATLQSIAVTAGNSSFALGLSLQLYATGTYSDGTTQNLTNSVTWTSSAPAVGMVGSTGLATGVTTGGFTARATMSGVTGTLPLTVTAAVLQSIVVTPANQVIVNVGGTTQFTATGHYSDGTTQNLTNSVHWTVTGPVNVGTISQTGQLSGVSVGVAGTVTATSGAISGSTGFTVVGI